MAERSPTRAPSLGPRSQRCGCGRHHRQGFDCGLVHERAPVPGGLHRAAVDGAGEIAVRLRKSGARPKPPLSSSNTICGAPKGNRNALKHGEFTAESVDFKKEFTALTRMARKTMTAIE